MLQRFRGGAVACAVAACMAMSVPALAQTTTAPDSDCRDFSQVRLSDFILVDNPRSCVPVSTAGWDAVPIKRPATGPNCGDFSQVYLSDFIFSDGRALPCFTFSFAFKAEVPTRKPELKGFGQNLELGAGPGVSVGVGGVIPGRPGTPHGAFGILFGVDGFFTQFDAKQITNQAGGGVLPVSGYYRSIGFIPYLGAGIVIQRNLWLAAKAGIGGAWNSVELTRNVPILDGSSFGPVWMIEGIVATAITPQIHAELRVSYMDNLESTTGSLAGGTPFTLGSVQSVAIKGGINVLSGPARYYFVDDSR
jgi:hypothetical protein